MPLCTHCSKPIKKDDGVAWTSFTRAVTLKPGTVHAACLSKNFPLFEGLALGGRQFLFGLPDWLARGVPTLIKAGLVISFLVAIVIIAFILVFAPEEIKSGLAFVFFIILLAPLLALLTIYLQFIRRVKQALEVVNTAGRENPVCEYCGKLILHREDAAARMTSWNPPFNTRVTVNHKTCLMRTADFYVKIFWFIVGVPWWSPALVSIALVAVGAAFTTMALLMPGRGLWTPTGVSFGVIAFAAASFEAMLFLSLRSAKKTLESQSA